MTDTWHSPQKILTLGHKGLDGLLDGDVEVTEKVDGSFVAFGMYDGELRVRSKGQQMHLDGIGGMFDEAVASIRSRAHLLTPGWQYRAEYLRTPKHNTLAYERHPDDHLVVFDILRGREDYLDCPDREAEAERIGLESVPVLHQGPGSDLSLSDLDELLDTESFLGGQKIEGLVVKNYAKWGADGKALMGKHVSESFKETHKKDWKARHQSRTDVVEKVIDTLRTEARWEKAVVHLRERGELTGSPKDIGPLMKEVQQDVEAEEAEWVKEQLWQWARKKVLRGSAAGLAEWYKRVLAEAEFAVDAEGVS